MPYGRRRLPSAAKPSPGAFGPNCITSTVRDTVGNTTFIRENGATTGVGVLATYQYDSLSRRSSVTFGNGVVQNYSYDNASRLATQTNDLASTANDLTQTFSYNPASQITSVTRSNDLYAWTGHANQNDGSTPNGLNQIANVGAKTVTHDSKGNITAVGTDSYGYSSENFLTSGPNSATLGYDPMGRLYQVASGAGTTRIGYDGLDRIAEYDGSNIIQRRYIHGPGVDNPITAYEGSGTTSRSFLSSDERGSIIALTDSSGTLLNINKYDEYGVPQSTNLGKFGYTGQAWVQEIGLWYYKARFYNAEDDGRFMQADPIGYAGGMNLYGYASNDPVNFADPSGLCQINTYGIWYDVPWNDFGKLNNPPDALDRRPVGCEFFFQQLLAPNADGGGGGGGGSGSGSDDEIVVTASRNHRLGDIRLNMNTGLESFFRLTASGSIIKVPLNGKWIKCGGGVQVFRGEVPINAFVLGDRAAIHTHEFFGPLSGIPGPGDYRIPAELGIPLYGITNYGAFKVEQRSGGIVSSLLTGSWGPGVSGPPSFSPNSSGGKNPTNRQLCARAG